MKTIENILKEFENLLEISDAENLKILKNCLKKIFGISRLVADKHSKGYSNFIQSFENLLDELKNEIAQNE